MDIKEYQIQKSLGALSYITAAKQTKCPKVLSALIEDTNDVEIYLLVALNKKTTIKTLTQIISAPACTYILVNACINHVKVTSNILINWLKQKYIGNNALIRTKIYILQAQEGIALNRRISVDVYADSTYYTDTTYTIPTTSATSTAYATRTFAPMRTSTSTVSAWE